MDQSAAAGGIERLDLALKRLEAAVSRAPAPAADGDLKARYDALVVQVEGALQGLDQLLSGLL